VQINIVKYSMGVVYYCCVVCGCMCTRPSCVYIFLYYMWCGVVVGVDRKIAKK